MRRSIIEPSAQCVRLVAIVFALGAACRAYDRDRYAALIDAHEAFETGAPDAAVGCADGETPCEAGCASLRTDPMNCGACGQTCVALHAVAGCANATCVVTSCESGHGDCDGVFGTGCEADEQSDPNHCGGCSTRCPAPTHGTATCVAGACAFACGPPFGDCDHVAATGCETDTGSDAMNCGACGRACPSNVPNGSVACIAGICTLACVSGYRDNGAGQCELPPPRPTAPISGARLTSQRPTLRWALPPGADGAHVELCRERSCQTVTQSFDATGSSAAPSMSLAPGVTFWRLRTHASGGANGTLNGTVWEFIVPHASSPRSTSCAAMLDVNGDGLSDAALGAPATTGSGAVRVYLAGAGGLPSVPSTTLFASGNDAAFGSHVARAGDVDGDGFGDLVVSGASGSVVVFRGSAAGIDRASAITIVPVGAPVQFGASIAPAGDTNGDGYADVIVGASSGSPAAYVLYGGASGLTASAALALATPMGALRFGAAVSGAGDVNADGYADVMVAAVGSNAVYVFHGGPSGVASLPSETLTGMASSSFGAALAAAGDVNGDGYCDALIGAPMGLSGGRAFVHLGSAAGLPNSATALSAASAMGFGSALDGGFDVNGDGTDDVLVCAPLSNGGAGACHLFAGGASGTSSVGTMVMVGEAGAQFGTSVAMDGDFDGDGDADAIVGAPAGMSSLGEAFVFAGTTGGLRSTPTVTFAGSASEHVGAAVAFAPRLRSPRYQSTAVGVARIGASVPSPI